MAEAEIYQTRKRRTDRRNACQSIAAGAETSQSGQTSQRRLLGKQSFGIEVVVTDVERLEETEGVQGEIAEGAYGIGGDVESTQQRQSRQRCETRNLVVAQIETLQRRKAVADVRRDIRPRCSRETHVFKTRRLRLSVSLENARACRRDFETRLGCREGTHR